MIPLHVIITAANTVSRASVAASSLSPETISVTISPDLDHGHGDREHDRAVRLADAVRHHLGVMDRGEHRARKHDADQHEHDGGGLAAPGRDEQDRRDERGPRWSSGS